MWTWLAWLACGGDVPLEERWILEIGATAVGEVSLFADGSLVERLGVPGGERRLESQLSADDEVLRAAELPRWLPRQPEGPVAVRWGALGEATVGQVGRSGAAMTLEVAGGSWRLEEGRLTGQLGPLRWTPGSAEELQDVASLLARPASPPPPPGTRVHWSAPVALPPAPGQRQEAGEIVVTPVLWAEVADTAWQGTSSPLWELEAAASAGSVRRALRVLLAKMDEVAWVIDPLPATPASTWERRAGGCLAQAQLFAAWSDAIGLPSRVVTGLRWQARGEEGVLAWHAWVEVDTGEPAGWIGLDPSGSRAPVDGRYLRVAEHGVAQADAVLDVMGLQWEVRAL